MMLFDTAMMILNDQVGASLEDKIEAYQFMNDNFYLDKLTPKQKMEFSNLVEGGIVYTIPFEYED